MKFHSMAGALAAFIAVTGVSARAEGTEAQGSKVGEMRTVASCAGVSADRSAAGANSMAASSAKTDESKPVTARTPK